MKLDWKTVQTRKDGSPRRMTAELADGCEIAISDANSSDQQIVTVKLSGGEIGNSVDYSATVRRHRPEGASLEDAKPWAIDEALNHLSVLAALAKTSAKALADDTEENA